MKEYEKILKALANGRRLQILKYLKTKKNASVTDISSHIKLSLKSTSRHLAVLFTANMVDREQKNLFVFYFLSKTSSRLSKIIVNHL
jgi:DNA-binding transcriptional ArsR family regulator